MARHAQITKNTKFPISLQYLKKEVSNEVDFFHAGKHRPVEMKIILEGGGVEVYQKILTKLVS